MYKSIPTFAVVFSLLLSLVCTEACRNTQDESKEEPTPVSTTIDSSIKHVVMPMVDSINDHLEKDAIRHKFSFRVQSSMDSIEYWERNGTPIRISLTYWSGESYIWPTYFLEKDKLIMARFRAMYKTSLYRYAIERMSYIKDDQIVYCEDRKMDLGAREIPAYLRLRTFQPTQTPLTEVAAEFMPLWPKVHEAVRQDMALKK